MKWDCICILLVKKYFIYKLVHNKAALVIWQLETETKSFLSNLSPMIKKIVPSNAGTLCALEGHDNSILIVDIPAKQVQTVIRGILFFFYLIKKGHTL